MFRKGFVYIQGIINFFEIIICAIGILTRKMWTCACGIIYKMHIFYTSRPCALDGFASRRSMRGE